MWFPLALSFALITSVSIIISKHILKETDEYLFLFLSGIISLPFFLLIILYFFEIPQFDKTFSTSVGASVLLNVIAGVLAYRAIKISDVSLIGPLSAFNPVFTTVIAFFTLGERISLRGVFGILLICVGAYALQISKAKRGWLSPIQSLLANKGIRLSLVAYFIWAITPIFQKVSIVHTAPQVPPFASFAGMLGSTIIYGLLVPTLSKSRKSIGFLKKYLLLFLLLGILGALGQTAAFTAFSLTSLGFATAVFKLSIVFTVILGWLFLKERDVRDRLLGSVLMLLGVFLLAI